MEANRMSNASVSNGSGAGPKKIGHRFEKGHPHFPVKHPYKIDRSEHARLKRKIIRDLKKQFASKLSVLRIQHINSIGDLSARLQLLGENADPIAAATLCNTIHRHLDALNE